MELRWFIPGRARLIIYLHFWKCTDIYHFLLLQGLKLTDNSFIIIKENAKYQWSVQFMFNYKTDFYLLPFCTWLLLYRYRYRYTFLPALTHTRTSKCPGFETRTVCHLFLLMKPCSYKIHIHYTSNQWI